LVPTLSRGEFFSVWNTTQYRLEEHVTGTHLESVATGERVESGFDESAPRLDAANELGLVELAARAQGDAGSPRLLPIAIFERCLQSAQVLGLHRPRV